MKKKITLRWGEVELDVENKVLSGKTRDDIEFTLSGVTEEAIVRWQGGEYVQNVFPHLSPDEREILISGFSAGAFDDMFGDDDG